MSFISLKEYINFLKKNNELLIIDDEVDPVLETTEIAIRGLLLNKPALLFTNVKGSDYPLIMNLYSSEKRVEMALRKDPDKLGSELIGFAQDLMPPSIKKIYKHKHLLKRLVSAVVPKYSVGNSQERVIETDLSRLPIIKTWPGDGGRFITLPQVFTYDPITGKRNVGMYRMQVFDKNSTGMHWQIQKGGGFHYFQAERLNQDFPLAVAIGTDPAMLFATIAALPENIDEVMFAGFLRGRRTTMTKALSLDIYVPAYAEFILEGYVKPKVRRLEGPFGDHFGHYSAEAEFPVFEIKTISSANKPIYPATCVGIPPMEDKFLGDATQKILGPLIKLLHPEIVSLWAYYEAGFHNLLVISVDERYKKESVKTALSIMGEGQLSLTKCVVLVDREVNPRDFLSVLDSIKKNFNPYEDFYMIPKVPLDTLDFTSFKMNLGSKIIIDATNKVNQNEEQVKPLDEKEIERKLLSLDSEILGTRLLNDCLLVVKVKERGRDILERSLKLDYLSGIKIIAMVSQDVELKSLEKIIWGIFTRFDGERDIIFTEQKLVGICPIYKGIMGIDATWKNGYPEPLKMDEEIIKKVDDFCYKYKW